MPPSAYTLAARRELYRRYLRHSSRMSRAVEQSAGPVADAGALVASHVLAPALGGFTEWVLCEALASGKKRLYFLARDGYFPWRAARILCEHYRLELDCRYLSCSRYSLRLPLLHTDRQQALDFVCRSGLHVTLDKVLGRAGLTGREKREVAAAVKWELPLEGSIPSSRLPELRRALSGCEPFLAYMDRHSQQALPALTGYLRQEGLGQEIPDALVDSGWMGSLQETMGRVLALMGRTGRPQGYYWGLYDLPARGREADYHSYFFSPSGPLREKVYFNNCVFEAVYTAPHGMTQGYRWEGERFVPLYGEASPAAVAFARQIEPRLLAYIRALCGQSARFPAGDQAGDRAVIGRLLREFMAFPTPAEARAFGRLPFTDDVVGGEGRLAAPLPGEELKKYGTIPRLLAKAGLQTGPKRESAWAQGSIVLAGGPVRHRLRQYALYQVLRHLRWGRKRKKKQGEKTDG